MIKDFTWVSTYIKRHGVASTVGNFVVSPSYSGMILAVEKDTFTVASDKGIKKQSIHDTAVIVPIHQKLEGMSIVLTGAFVLDKQDLTREHLTRCLTFQSVKVQSAVSSKGTDYVVTSNPKVLSGKLQKARNLGIDVIGQEQLYAMMISGVPAKSI